MKIRNRILIYFLSITLFAILVVVADSFYNVDSNIVNNAESKLEAIASIQYNRVRSETEHHKIQAGLVANRTSLTEDVVNFNKTQDTKYAESLVTRAKDVQTSVSEFKSVYILDKNFKTIAGTDLTNIEKQINNKDLKDIKIGKHVFIFESDDPIKKLLVTAPITKDKEFAGLVTIVTEAKELQNIMTDYSGLGKTGETAICITNQKGDAEFIRPPRFADSNTIITISRDRTNIAAIRALDKYEGLTKDSLDYRGHSVYAVTKYIDSVDWGLVIKIDKNEFYQPIFSHASQLAILSLLLIILIIIIAKYLANSVSKPIEKLQDGVKEIDNGNLDYKVGITTKDEIGKLSRAFDDMVAAVKESRSEIDKQVADQTKEIIDNQQDLDNQRKAILNILEDVEVEKELTAKEKDKISTILHSIGDAVFVVDNNFNIILTNQVTADLASLTQEELINKKYSDVLRFVFDSEDKKQEKVNDRFIKDALSSGKVQEMSNHTVLINAKGERIPVSDSAAPLKDKDGHIIGCVVVFRDVSKERSIDKAKTEFVSLASHQLRTPLSAINWYTEMLINGDVGKMTTDQTKYLQEIYHGNQRMVSLVNALLNTLRIELGTFAIEPIMMDIVKSSEEIVKEMQISAKAKKIELTTNYKDKLPQILADPKIYQIIIQNLLSNAVKYTPDKGKVSLTIKKNNSNILIEVKDNGYGIPKAQQKEMFKKLFRADNVRAKDTEGTGLGLYIVKSIVEQSGGKIWFESVENKGTTFSVTFPLSGMTKKTGTKALEDIK